MTKESILDYFKVKSQDQGQNLHPLIHDPILRNLVVAWTMTEVDFGEPDLSSFAGEEVAKALQGEVVTPEIDNRRWKALWSKVRYDREELANALKLDPLKISRMVDRAAAYRLIFPDGTAAELAIKYIKGEVAKSLQKKTGPKKKPEA
jgi:hypothetical protein